MVDKLRLDLLFEPGAAFYAASEDLPKIFELLSKSPILDGVSGLPNKWRLVVDANTILGDLYWMERKRTEPTAYPGLLEAMVSGIVEIYAPSFIEEEINEKILKFDCRYHLEESRMIWNWAKFKESIHLCSPNEELVAKYFREGDDRMDAPYLALAEELGGLPIVSVDTDIQRMGGKALAPASLAPKLRAAARSMAVWLHCKVQVRLTLFLVMVILFGLGSVFRALFSRIPTWAKLTVLTLIGTSIYFGWKKISKNEKTISFMSDAWDTFIAIGIRLLERKKLAQDKIAAVNTEIKG